MNGFMLGRQFSMNCRGCSRSRGPVILRRWNGFSPRELVKGDCGMELLPTERILMAVLDGFDSRYMRIP